MNTVEYLNKYHTDALEGLNKVCEQEILRASSQSMHLANLCIQGNGMTGSEQTCLITDKKVFGARWPNLNTNWLVILYFPEANFYNL